MLLTQLETDLLAESLSGGPATSDGLANSVVCAGDESGGGAGGRGGGGGGGGGRPEILIWRGLFMRSAALLETGTHSTCVSVYTPSTARHCQSRKLTRVRPIHRLNTFTLVLSLVNH